MQDKLRSFMLACQDEETGGFADRPGDVVILLFVFLLVFTTVDWEKW